MEREIRGGWGSVTLPIQEGPLHSLRGDYSPLNGPTTSPASGGNATKGNGKIARSPGGGVLSGLGKGGTGRLEAPTSRYLG